MTDDGEPRVVITPIVTAILHSDKPAPDLHGFPTLAGRSLDEAAKQPGYQVVLEPLPKAAM
jgi:hypothetical protein